MSQQDFAVANRLVAGLPELDRTQLLARCELVHLARGDVFHFHAAGKHIKHACFPLDCFLSLVTQVDDSADLGVRLVGQEGLLGVVLALGINELPLRAQVQCSGNALLIKAADLRAELARSAALRDRLNAYIYVLMVQLANSGACFRHVIENRLARWLLMSGDCTHSDAFHITHDQLAYVLGVRRAGITLAAQILQSRGLIQYQRGHVRILDRPSLEAAACSCYHFDRKIYQRLLGVA